MLATFVLKCMYNGWKEGHLPGDEYIGAITLEETSKPSKPIHIESDKKIEVGSKEIYTKVGSRIRFVKRFSQGVWSSLLPNLMQPTKLSVR